MKAMMWKRGETGTVLDLMEVADPEVGPGQVAIAVQAASVNRADLVQRAGGSYLPGASLAMTPAGLDASGQVVEVGEQVESLKVGDRVMTMATGGLAERVVVDATMAVPIPEGWSAIEGAAAIVGLMAEHNALHTAARLVAGESVLIHGASSGVGLQAVQLARYLGAGNVIATTRSSRASGLVGNLGAHHVIDTSSEDFTDRVRHITNKRGVDVIIDHVGGPYLAGNFECAAVRARLVSVGRLGGGQGYLDMGTLALKRLEIIGVTFRTRAPDEKAEIAAGVRDLLDTPRAGEALRPTVDQTFVWTEAARAYEVMESNAHLGKLVLEVSSQ